MKIFANSKFCEKRNKIWRAILQTCYPDINSFENSLYFHQIDFLTRVILKFRSDKQEKYNRVLQNKRRSCVRVFIISKLKFFKSISTSIPVTIVSR